MPSTFLEISPLGGRLTCQCAAVDGPTRIAAAHFLRQLLGLVLQVSARPEPPSWLGLGQRRWWWRERERRVTALGGRCGAGAAVAVDARSAVRATQPCTPVSAAGAELTVLGTGCDKVRVGFLRPKPNKYRNATIFLSPAGDHTWPRSPRGNGPDMSKGRQRESVYFS